MPLILVKKKRSGYDVLCVCVIVCVCVCVCVCMCVFVCLFVLCALCVFLEKPIDVFQGQKKGRLLPKPVKSEQVGE